MRLQINIRIPSSGWEAQDLWSSYVLMCEESWSERTESQHADRNQDNRWESFWQKLNSWLWSLENLSIFLALPVGRAFSIHLRTHVLGFGLIGQFQSQVFSLANPPLIGAGLYWVIEEEESGAIFSWMTWATVGEWWISTTHTHMNMAWCHEEKEKLLPGSSQSRRPPLR